MRPNLYVERNPHCRLRVEGSHYHVSTQVAGTMGYMPPEYLHGATMATVVGDVYSFGGADAGDCHGAPQLSVLREDRREVRLIEWVAKMVERKKYMDMVDGSIIGKDGGGDDLEESVVMEVFKIFVKCADEKWKSRATMEEVVEQLDRILTAKTSNEEEIDR